MRTQHLAALSAMILTALGLGGCDPSSSKAETKSNSRPAPLIVHRGTSTSKEAQKVTAKDSKTVISRTKNASPSQPITTADGQKINPRDPKAPTTIRDFLRMFKGEKITVADRTDSLAPVYRRAFIECIKTLGGAEQALLEVDESCKFITIRFRDMKSVDALLESPPDLLLYRNYVMVPAEKPSASWETLCKVIERFGGRRVASPARDASSMLSQLQTVRAQIKQFKSKEGPFPNFAASQWEQMVKGRYIPSPPRNPFSPRGVGDRIEIITTIGSTGELVSASKAGWVWNSADELMFPAGTTEQKLRAYLAGAPGGKHYIAMPEGHVAARLEIFRKTLEYLRAAKQSGNSGSMAVGAGEAAKTTGSANPTLAELQAAIKKISSSTDNPFTRSSMIHAAVWSQRNPPVSGGAGWNYDQNAGQIWPNSNVVGENGF